MSERKGHYGIQMDESKPEQSQHVVDLVNASEQTANDFRKALEIA